MKTTMYIWVFWGHIGGRFKEQTARFFFAKDTQVLPLINLIFGADKSPSLSMLSLGLEFGSLDVPSVGRLEC